MIAVTVWNENRHEQNPEHPASKIYPRGIHGAIADYLREQPGLEARIAALDEPEHGLTQDVLDSTDVLVWWGHVAHGEVTDEVVARVHWRVLDGMGLIVLHSASMSKIFQRRNFDPAVCSCALPRPWFQRVRSVLRLSLPERACCKRRSRVLIWFVK